MPSKYFKWPFAALLLTLSSWAAAAELGRVATLTAGRCTRDLNPWGHASRCDCSFNAVYSAKSGYCLQGTPYQLSTQGVLYTDLVAIGGETTGIAVESDQGFIELIVSRSMRESLANAGGKRIEVQGELILIQGVEIAQRRALIVESLNVLE